VKKITGLYDVAIVTHPAYEQTNVGLREASEAIDKAIEEQLKRECGDDDEAKKKAEEEQRQLEEQEQRFREQQAMRLRHRAQRMRTEQELESLIF
jgi:phage head maturation protease